MQQKENIPPPLLNLNTLLSCPNGIAEGKTWKRLITFHHNHRKAKRKEKSCIDLKEMNTASRGRKRTLSLWTSSKKIHFN